MRTQPAGLFCRDLRRKGYGYAAAVDYWRQHGQPERMDADKNGVPCETIYPAKSVSAYWAQRGPVVQAGVPSGLLCRDLLARGRTYPQAVAYWYAEGAPPRMDEDRNGIPCETVYSAASVRAFWGG